MVVRLPAARRRRQLLETALPVFARNGFHATSMEQVADAAGVTKPVLYQHFRSKRELYLALLEDVGNRLLEEVGKATAAAAGPHQQVTAGFTAYFRFVAESTDAFQLLFGSGARRDQEFADAVRRVESVIADAIAGLIEADIEPEHRRLLAYGLVGLAETTGRLLVADGTVMDPDMLARHISQLAWAGLRGVTRP